MGSQLIRDGVTLPHGRGSLTIQYDCDQSFIP